MKPILIADVYDPSRAQSVIVRADEPLENALRQFVQEPWLRGLFVVDRENQLLGVVTRSDLLEWARLRMGTALTGPSVKPDRIVRLAQLVRAELVRDAIHPHSDRVAVRPEEPVDHALKNMLQYDLIAIPVVDDRGTILGDLTLSHVLRYLLDVDEEDEASQSTG